MKINKTPITILIHILLWAVLGFVLLTYTPLNWGVKLPMQFWIKHVLHYVILIVIFYFNYKLLTPQLLLKQKTFGFVLFCIFLILFTMLVNEWLNQELLLSKIKKEILFANKVHEKFDMLMLFTILLVLGLSTSITVFQHRQNELRKHQELKEEQISSELSFLKAQIHPHFFFNTLNNIYSLTYTNVEASRESLHKLSSMMRYLLYETQNDKTLLSNELRFITDYIELMRMRLNENNTVEVIIPNQINEYSIAPMLLLPFIENAFKHGISGQGVGKIMVHVRQENEKLYLSVINNVFEKPKGEIDDGGIGLNNTKRRLNLLYENRFILTHVLKPDNIYEVQLEIELE